MLHSDRRTGFRVPMQPMQMFLNQYISNQPFRALAANLSESGVLLNRVKSRRQQRDPEQRVVALEFELPNTGETIWARGEICSQEEDEYFHNDHIRFTAMPRVHAKLLRDYCIEHRRQHLDQLLSRIRRTPN